MGSQRQQSEERGGYSGGMMPPLPSTDVSDLDEERKKELIMEKKLRACRVNIIPRTAGYFADAPLPPPRPVSKKPPPPTPSPSSVEKASNPIALRYWNQCSGSSAERKISAPAITTSTSSFSDTPPWATSDTINLSLPAQTKARTHSSFPVRVPDITKRVRSESVPRFCNFDNEPLTVVDDKVEVVKVLSTAGTGIKRDNEKKEALGNINRFITMDKMKKDDAVRSEKNKKREVQMQEVKIEIVPDKPYTQVKQEQIKISSQRTNFINNATIARIPKSPEPFRGGRQRDLSEPRHSSRHSDHHLTVANNNIIAKENGQTNQNDENNKVDKIVSQIKSLGDDDKHRIFLNLFNEMSFNAKSTLMANILDELKHRNGTDQITNSGSGGGNKTSVSVSNLINSSCQTNLKHDTSKLNDTKEKNVVNALPDNKSAVEEVKNDLNNSENNVSIESCKAESKVDEDVGEQNVVVCETIVINEAKNKVSVNVPNIKIDIVDDESKASSGDRDDAQAEWDWEDGEEMEYEFYEQEITKL